MNATLKQAGKLLELVDQKDLTNVELQSAIVSGIISDVFESAKTGSIDGAKRDDIRVLLGLEPLVPPVPKTVITPYTLLVDCRPLAKMIEAGKYDWANTEINEKRFPVNGKGSHTVESALFQFCFDISSEDAIKEMEQAGYRPATTEEILAFGEHNPELQKQFPIVELASVAEVSGLRCVLYLDTLGSERGLRLRWFDVGWRGRYRFLAVRK